MCVCVYYGGSVGCDAKKTQQMTQIMASSQSKFYYLLDAQSAYLLKLSRFFIRLFIFYQTTKMQSSFFNVIVLVATKRNTYLGVFG